MVRQGSAKALCVGSIPTPASISNQRKEGFIKSSYGVGLLEGKPRTFFISSAWSSGGGLTGLMLALFAALLPQKMVKVRKAFGITSAPGIE